MKATGIVRQVDALGRVVIPIEVRRVLDIEIKDGLEIFTEGDHIILRKYEPTCVICGEGRNTVIFREKLICKLCISEIKTQ